MADRIRDAYGVLLAGGSGTRLWPVSRSLYPKQLAIRIGRDSLVQHTVRRLTPVLHPDRIHIVCGESHADEMARHLGEIGFHASGNIIEEPCGRNTAPAILLAVLNLMSLDPDSVLCVFPADHVIGNTRLFQDKLIQAIELARDGHIVTFGIRPGYPETGYGYIEGATEVPGGARQIKRFVEKPDRETAEAYIASGDFYWNSGMFVFRASVMADEFRTYQSGLFGQMADACRETGVPSHGDYERLPDISIDYAIMEKTNRGVLLPAEFGWSDIGSWKSLYDFLPKDEGGNVVDGDVVVRDTRDSLILGKERLIATNGLRHAVVIETPDSVFVSDMDSSRDVKDIVDQLKERGRQETVCHKTRYHSWGTVTELLQTIDYRLDRFTIDPGESYTFDIGEAGVWRLVVARGAAAVDRRRATRR